MRAPKPRGLSKVGPEPAKLAEGTRAFGLAKAIRVSRQTVNELINEKRAVSAAMALRLSRYFGNSPEFWLDAQRAVDLWEAEREHKADLHKIKPATAA